jgi:hypothetical protein
MLAVRTYFIIIPIMWVTSFILVSPLLIWHGQKLIPGEYVCLVPKDDPFSIAYSTLIVYGIPFNVLAFTYFQVHQFLHRQATLTILDATSRSRHRKRDVLVFRRIVIVVILLGSYGTPNSVMLIMLAITHQLVPVFYRVLELSFAACVLTLSVALVYVNPQIRKEIKLCSPKTPVEVVGAHEFQLKQRTLDRRSQLQVVTEPL